MKLFVYRLYQLFVMVPLMLAVTVPAAIVTIIGCSLGGGRFWGYWPGHLWGRLMCWLSLVRVTVRGRENISSGTSYVFVANHQGAYDIFSIYGFLNHDFRWMMKSELRSIPLVGFACEKSRQIYVDNSSPSAVRRTMDRAEKLLGRGMSIVVFPEGARTWNGKVRKFKRGAYALAQEFRLPVVPITIDGAFDILPRFKKIPHWGHITLTIHEPILPDAEKGHDLQTVMNESRAAILSVLPEQE